MSPRTSTPTPAGRYTGIAGTGRAGAGSIPPRPTRPAASPSNIASGRHVPPGRTPPSSSPSSGSRATTSPAPSPTGSGSRSTTSSSTSSSSSSGGRKSSLFGKLGGSSKTGFGRLAGGTNPATGRRNRYSVVIAGEYLACMAMVALSGAGVGKDQAPPAFSDPALVLVRLTAVSFLFFVLALLSAGERIGKIAAAFGGLVTLGVAFNAVGEWNALAGLFGGSSSSTGSGGAQQGGTAGTSPAAAGSKPTGGGRYQVG